MTVLLLALTCTTWGLIVEASYSCQGWGKVASISYSTCTWACKGGYTPTDKRTFCHVVELDKGLTEFTQTNFDHVVDRHLDQHDKDYDAPCDEEPEERQRPGQRRP